MSILAIMGSGETAPTMIRTHRRLFDRTFAAGTGPAVMLDTTFGFQENADDLVTRSLGYFAESVGRPVEAAPWRRCDDPDVVTRERTLATLARARWVFAGPGSPTYALRQWRGTGVPDAMTEVLRRDGTVVVGSAAACTVGSHAVPVYEIYKAGSDLYWEAGLDLLGRLAGLRAAVVPHFDNHEGGTYDTRYCYLGADRLARLEQLLPDGVGVLGVDEHTAVVVDLDAGTVEVTGNGVLTVRGGGRSTEFEAGATVGLDRVAEMLAGAPVAAAPAAAPAPRPAETVAPRESPSLRAVADSHRTAFEASLAARDTGSCAQVLLSLEQDIHDWSADTLQSDDLPHARRILRAMVVDLAQLAGSGPGDVRGVVAPLVEAMLSMRVRAREARDWAASDAIRDALAAAGVEVRDTPEGPRWDVTG